MTGSDLVFIVGSPRSGTTWIQKLLAAAPGIATGQESDIFTTCIGPAVQAYHHSLTHPSGRGGTGLACYLTADEMRTMMRSLLYAVVRKVPAMANARYFVEKTPSHALFVDAIHWVVPEARYIHIVRDPRDVVASMLDASRGWGAVWAPRTVMAAVRMWRRHVLAAEADLADVPAGLQRLIRFEDLKVAPARILQELLTWLGLEVSPGQLEELVAGSPQVLLERHGEYARRGSAYAEEPEGFIRQRAAGQGWRTDIGLLRGAMVYALVRSIMLRYGYSWHGSSPC